MADNGKDGEIDTSAAEAFEKYLVPTIFGPWSEAMIDHARTEENHRLLDVGCGSGAAARYAAQIVGTGGSVDRLATGRCDGYALQRWCLRYCGRQSTFAVSPR